MNKSLRVLFVEDSEDDALLLQREFDKAGYHVESRRVYSLDALNSALHDGGWDLILSDYNLPGFTCNEVLRLAGEYELDIPVIVISGTMGEEVAVEVMHAGAHDYILKDRVTRLIPAVERELEEMKIHRERRLAIEQLMESEERFRQLTETIVETFLLIDIQTMTLLYVSPSFELLTEIPRARMIGASTERLLDIVHPEDVPRVQEKLLTTAGWINFNDEFRTMRLSGEVRWIHTRHFPVKDKLGIPHRIAVIAQDITDRKRMEQEMKKMFRVLEQTADSVLVTDSRGIIEYVNPAFENVTGFNRNEVLGGRPNILKSGFQDDSFYARVWEAVSSGMPFSDIFINRRKDGELFYESKTITPLRDDDGVITHYVATGRDITDRLRAEERFQQIVNYDTVTGLANRILLLDRLEQALLEARRRTLHVAVLCIRIGLSEVFGDIHDHAVGEQLLRALAQRLREAVGHEVTVARLSSDDFTVMELGSGSRREVELLAKVILAAFAQPVEAEGYRIFVSPAIGISLFPDDADEAELLLQHASSALTHARQEIHEPCQFYRRGMGRKKGHLSS